MKDNIMSIKKQENGTYTVRIRFTDATGERREKKKNNIKIITLAKRWERDILVDIENGVFDEIITPVEPLEITMNDLIDKFMVDYGRNKRLTTTSKVKRFFNMYILTSEWFDNKLVSSIQRLDIQKWLDWLANQHTTYKKQSNYLKKVFDFAVAYDYIESNPFTGIRYPTAIPKPDRSYRVDVYDYDQLQTFMQSVQAKYNTQDLEYRKYTYLRLLAFTGMRNGETRALLWSDIEFTDNGANINITKTMSETTGHGVIVNQPKTKAGQRTVIVDNTTAQTLKHWHNIQQQAQMASGVRSDVVFTNQQLVKRISANQPREWLLTAIKDTDTPQINVHGLRHTYITLAVQAGMDIKTLQAQVGHDDINTTLNIYASVTKDMRAKTADVFTSLVNF